MHLTSKPISSLYNRAKRIRVLSKENKVAYRESTEQFHTHRQLTYWPRTSIFTCEGEDVNSTAGWNVGSEQTTVMLKLNFCCVLWSQWAFGLVGFRHKNPWVRLERRLWTSSEITLRYVSTRTVGAVKEYRAVAGSGVSGRRRKVCEQLSKWTLFPLFQDLNISECHFLKVKDHRDKTSKCAYLPFWPPLKD